MCKLLREDVVFEVGALEGIHEAVVLHEQREHPQAVREGNV